MERIGQMFFNRLSISGTNECNENSSLACSAENPDKLNNTVAHSACSQWWHFSQGQNEPVPATYITLWCHAQPFHHIPPLQRLSQNLHDNILVHLDFLYNKESPWHCHLYLLESLYQTDNIYCNSIHHCAASFLEAWLWQEYQHLHKLNTLWHSYFHYLHWYLYLAFQPWPGTVW